VLIRVLVHGIIKCQIRKPQNLETKIKLSYSFEMVRMMNDLSISNKEKGNKNNGRRRTIVTM